MNENVNKIITAIFSKDFPDVVKVKRIKTNVA